MSDQRIRVPGDAAYENGCQGDSDTARVLFVEAKQRIEGRYAHGIFLAHGVFDSRTRLNFSAFHVDRGKHSLATSVKGSLDTRRNARILGDLLLVKPTKLM